MGERSKEVDAYIAGAPEFARPILTKLRDAFHAGCPKVEERIKWGVPSFEYKGMLGGMSAFKKHVGYGFWKARLLEDPEGLFDRGPRASSMGVRAATLADLPTKKVLVDYVRRARKLNDDGVKETKLTRSKTSTRVAVPDDLAKALAKSAKARKTFESFPPSARRDYVNWIEDAKRPATREKRLATTVEWLAEGKRRNWKYENC
jgi:uncharacterized protein YdeI (YjbR/CyaY-like superfamily)